MKHLLLDLPPFLVSTILAFDDVSHQSLSLWLCGSRELQDKLSKSISIVALRSAWSATKARIPLYLKNLLSLRDLCFDCGDSDITNPDDAIIILQTLAPTLTKLDFRVGNAKDVFTHCIDSTASSNGPMLISTLVNLDTLKFSRGSLLMTADWLQALPPSVTHLQSRSVALGAAAQAIVEAIPPTVTKLSIGTNFFEPNAMDNVLPFLKSPTLTTVELHMYNRKIGMLSLLPTEVPPHVTRLGRTLAVSASCPRPHCQISLPIEVEHDISFTEEGIFQPFPGKPLLLNAINARNITLSSASLRSLPRTLNHLACSLNWTDVQPDDWPPALRILKVYHRIGETLPIPTHFPASLERITLRGFVSRPPMEAIFNILPKNLRSFDTDHLMLAGEGNFDFPPNLTTLRLAKVDLAKFEAIEEPGADPTEDEDDMFFGGFGAGPGSGPAELAITRCFPFHKLPLSLRILDAPLGQIPLSKLQFLPPDLTGLNCELVKDADYDPEDPVLLQRARYLVLEGRKSGAKMSPAVNAFFASNPTRIAVADLLPKTLVALYINKCDEFDGWSRLPLLRALKVTGEELFPGDVMLEIPLDCMISLSVNLEWSSESQLQHVGPRIQWLDVPNARMIKRPLLRHDRKFAEFLDVLPYH